MAQAKTLSQVELDQVLNYVSTKKYALRDRAIILTSFLGGLRVAEIASLKMGDVVNPTAAGMKAGGFVHHSVHVKKHAAGFKNHDDNVKAMCGGGMAKGKK